jgi:hypothetical protein
MKEDLFRYLKETRGMDIPMLEDQGGQSNQRLKSGAPQAVFPEQMMRK